MSSAQAIDMDRRSGTCRNIIFWVIAVIAAAGFIDVAAGGLSFTTFAGMFLGLAFVGLFMTNMRMFIIVFVASRSLLEYFLEPTRFYIGGQSVQVIGLLGAVIFFGGIIYIIMNDVKIRETSVLVPMIIFMLAAVPSTLLFSTDKMVGVKDWIGTASTIVLYILVATIFTSKKDIKLMLWAILISAIPPLILGFYQLFTNSGNLNTAGFNRILGTFQHPNQYALHLGMVLLLLIPLLMETKINWQRIFYAGLGALLVMSLIFTYSRAIWILFILSLMLIAAIRYKKLLLAAPIGLVLVIVFVPSILGRFQEALGFSQGQGSLFFRVEMWLYLLPHFYASPIVGNGLGSFASYTTTGMGRFFLPHNDYIRLLVDTGIVGIAAYLTAMYALIRGSIRSYLAQTDQLYKVISLVLLAVVVMYVLGGMTDNLFRAGATQTYFWTLAGLVAAAARSIQPKPGGEQLTLTGDEA